MVRWIKVRTAEGDLRALVFWAGPKQGDGISLKLPLEKVAWVLARPAGTPDHARSISTTPCRTSKRSA
jgi:hypothetical protein